MRKSIHLLLISVMALLLLSACGSFSDSDKQSSEKAQQTEKAGKSFLNPIGTEKFSQIEIDKRTQVVYVGRPTCPDCQAFQPILQQVLKENDWGKLDYYNTDQAGEKDRKAMISALKKVKIDSVPTLIAFKNGKVQAIFHGNDSKKELTDWLRKNLS
ncbi:thioredoxin family protein [Listeria aquatica]|uniref:Thioredoxin family protein n=1 Tax=Listeria aquatica TaxID=1494960 RepID=A0A841ZMY6_9LIST|nr:thioredoxin family protein [Listeria aquatica]MBC1520545.1 thioredoxin family protein [Listeria aquatica]